MRLGRLAMTAGWGLAFTLFAGPVLANPPEIRDSIRIDLGECPAGKLVIDVTLRVLNDSDVGVASYWAYDNYTRHVRVWQTEPTTFCAVYEGEGTFKSIAGVSPAGTGNIAAGVTGSMSGGYRLTITGTLNPNPAYKRKGFLGTFDFGWTGNPAAPAPHPFSFFGTYFEPGPTVNAFWYGFVYADHDGNMWINSPGNAGDIP